MAAAVMPPLYSEDSEDSVLRNFLDEEMNQHVQTSSPILEMPEENGFMANPLEGRRLFDSPSQRTRSSQHSRRSDSADFLDLGGPTSRHESYESPSRRSRTSRTSQSRQQANPAAGNAPSESSKSSKHQSHRSSSSTVTSPPQQRSRPVTEHDFTTGHASQHPSHDSPSNHSRTSHTRKHSRNISSSSKSSKNPEELLRRLLEQTQEANTLRRALQLAVDRMHANADEAALSERSRLQAQTAEYVHRLNESRIAAQQEAMQASQDLRIHQLELQSAHEEARRARELLAIVEQERHGAVQAAKEARERTRELYQRYMVDYSWHSGHDSAMRAGIEEGLLRERLRALGKEIREDSGYYDQPPPEHLSEGRPRDPIQPMHQGPSQPGEGLLHRPAPHGFRSAFSEPNLQEHHLQDEPAPNIQVFLPDSGGIQQPVPITFPHPQPAPPSDPRAPSPAVQVYEIDIPPPAVLERQYSTRSGDPIRKSKGPWLTADEHMALENAGHQRQLQEQYQQQMQMHQQQQQQPEYDSDEEEYRPQNVTFAEPPQNNQPKKPKESWYRSLRRKLSGKSKPKQENLAPYGPYSKYASAPVPQEPPSPEQPQSWYIVKPGQGQSPHVQSTNVGVSMHHPSDSVSMTGGIPPMAMGMNVPPVAASNASQRSGGPARSYRPRAESLSIIAEDPQNGMTPMKSVKSGQPRVRSVSMDVDQSSVHPSIGQSAYVAPNVMEGWRNSTATGRSSQMPKRGPKRPSNLTVPAPLSLNVPGSVPPGALEAAGVSDSSGFLKPPRRSSRIPDSQSDPVAPPQPSAPVNIDVQSPSNSPSETTGTALVDGGYLSPSLSAGPVPVHQPSIHSLASGRRTQRQQQQPYEATGAPVARPPSRSAHLASPTPSRGGRSIADSPQAPPNLLGLSAPNDPHKPPVPRKSPRPSEIDLQIDEAFRPASRFSQRSRGTVRASPPEHRAPSISASGHGHMRTASDPHWGAKTPSVRSRKVSIDRQTDGSPVASLNERKLIRVPSSNSENGKSLYGRFTSDGYLDPAFYAADENTQPTRKGTPSMRSHHSRAGSSPGLSYMTDPNLKTPR